MHKTSQSQTFRFIHVIQWQRTLTMMAQIFQNIINIGNIFIHPTPDLIHRRTNQSILIFEVTNLQRNVSRPIMKEILRQNVIKIIGHRTPIKRRPG